MQNYWILIAVAVIAAACASASYYLKKRSSQESVSEAVREERPVPPVMRADPVVERSAGEPSAPEPEHGPEAAEEPAGDAPSEFPITDELEPSEEPPIYARLEKEKEEAAAKAAREADSVLTPEANGFETVPFDPSVQWALMIRPDEGRTISIGTVSSLVKSLASLRTNPPIKLPVEVWARSRKDNRYYPTKFLPTEALDIVVTVVFTNRVDKLDELNANLIRSICEQLATQCDAQLETSVDVSRVAEFSEKNASFIEIFNSVLDMLIVPPQQGFDKAKLSEVLEGIGFKREGERWVHRVVPSTREGEYYAHFTAEHPDALSITLDLPLCNIARGDLDRLFAICNHVACHLGCQWTDGRGRPLTVAGALLVSDKIRHDLENMGRYGVTAGSERAHRLFSYGV